jgi:Ser-tRNA(Ala) deacylase AlaX
MSKEKKPLIDLKGSGDYKRTTSEIVDDYLKIEDLQIDDKIEEIDKKFNELRKKSNSSIIQSQIIKKKFLRNLTEIQMS